MFIDTHAHLNFKAFKDDLADVIDRAQKSGVEKIVIPGAKIDSSEKAIEIAHKFPVCFAAVGIHPHHCHDIPRVKLSEAMEKLSSLASKPKVVAIGEIGLDKHRYKDYPSVSQEEFSAQKLLLLAQLSVAQKNRLPVILHCRDAQDEMIALVESYKRKYRHLAGVFHCFEGTPKHLKKVLDLGFFVGFDGNVTYKENTHLHTLVQQTPLRRLVLETDSPFLAPFPHRGTRNEPAYIKNTYLSVSLLKSVSLEEIVSQTALNSISLFRLTRPL